MNNTDRAKWLEKIKHNIESHGFHMYLVMGGLTPRFVYSIGLSPVIGFEIVFAGAIFYDNV